MAERVPLNQDENPFDRLRNAIRELRELAILADIHACDGMNDTAEREMRRIAEIADDARQTAHILVLRIQIEGGTRGPLAPTRRNGARYGAPHSSRYA